MVALHLCRRQEGRLPRGTVKEGPRKGGRTRTSARQQGGGMNASKLPGVPGLPCSRSCFSNLDLPRCEPASETDALLPTSTPMAFLLPEGSRSASKPSEFQQGVTIG